MKKIDLSLLLLLTFATANSQELKTFEGLYPVPKTIKKEFFKRAYNNLIFSGCVEGNCLNGQGTYLRVLAESYANAGLSEAYLTNTNLIYILTRGLFSDSGAVCEGSSTFTIRAMSRKNAPTDDFSPENPVARADTSTEGLRTGTFLFRNNGYYSYGTTQLKGAAQKYNVKKAEAWCVGGTVKYATVEYNDKNKIRKFTGIINDSLQPVYGVATNADGSVFNGFFLRNNVTGPGYYFKNSTAAEGLPEQGAGEFDFMPDMQLLRKIFDNRVPANSFDIKLYWDPEKQKELKLVNNKMIEFNPGSATFGSGTIFGDDGKLKDYTYTGNGIFISDHNLFYFGSFEKGLPNGKGFLYYKYVTMPGMNTYDWPIQTHLRYGNYIEGFFNDGWLTFDNGSSIIRYYIKETPVNEPDFPLQVELINKGATEPLVHLGNLYMEGKTVKQDPVKALSYYNRAAVHGNIQALRKLGKLYETGNANAGIKRDSLKAISYFRRGAEKKPSATVTAEEIRACTNEYFKAAYTFITDKQAASFQLSDEYNFSSELVRLISARYAEEQRQYELGKTVNGSGNSGGAFDYTAQQLTRQLFIRDTSYVNVWNDYVSTTVFYLIMQTDGQTAQVTYSFANDPTARVKTVNFSLFAAKNSPYRLAKKKYVFCQTCNGTGSVTVTSTFKHTNDYEYTLGKKITYTATSTSQEVCGKCYGATFCPADGSEPEWLKGHFTQAKKR